MAETIAQAYVQILPSTEGIQGSLTELLGGEADKAGSDAGGKWGKAFGAALGAGAALATGAAAFGTAIVQQSGEVAAYGDNIDKMSQKLGISAEAYQEWDAILQHSGTSIDSMLAPMKTLAVAAETGSDAFAALGLSQEQVASLSQEDLFATTIAALQGVSDTTERTYLASQLLGRGATELGPLLNTSAEEVEAMRKRVHELGGVMSDEAVKAAAAYQDTLQDLNTAQESLIRGLVSDFLPGITTVMSGVTEIFSGDSDQGLAAIEDGINSLVDKISENAPKLMETGGRIVISLGQAIISNLPSLLSVGSQVILELATDLISELPALIDVGFQILVTLADALVAALPELIPATVDMILTIVDKLTDPDTLMQLIEVAFTLIGAIATGLIDAIPKLVEKAPEIIGNLVESLIKLGPKLLECGGELIVQVAKGLWEGIGKIGEVIADLWHSLTDWFGQIIRNAVQWGRDLISNFIDGIFGKKKDLEDAVSDSAQTVEDYMGFSEPKKGPLSDFHTYAPDMVELFDEGLRANDYKLQAQLTESLSLRGLRQDLRQETAQPAAAGGSQARPSEPRQQTVVLMLDRTELARTVFRLNNEETQRVGLVLSGGAA